MVEGTMNKTLQLLSSVWAPKNGLSTLEHFLGLFLPCLHPNALCNVIIYYVTIQLQMIIHTNRTF